ncbi:hypothetical protein JD276_13990 [Leucobacter sp. CSA1]|uniref:Uncharacterized protein n=1 Tax=Leucobacter chromiisoli TaxID=2796471 RepID=A0A934QBI9_9MICO|nr:hypothetical protein [Leucobacter chromiisoli]MBK0420144.1 hypothetical protein [Leucobacter chromiisoli]
MTDALFLIGDIIMLTALAGAAVFAASYVAFFNWRSTSAGRSLLYFVLALIAWASQSVLARLNPDYMGREWVRIVVYVFIAATVWRLVATLWRSWGRPFEVTPRKPRPPSASRMPK